MHGAIRSKFRNQGDAALEPLTSQLGAGGVSPIQLQVLAAVLAAVGGWVVATGHLPIGGLVWLCALALVWLASAMANGKTVYKRLLGDTLGALSEALVLVGVTVHLSTIGNQLAVHYAALTLASVLLAGYVRTSAEVLGLGADVGVATRIERSLLIVIMLFTAEPLTGLRVILALSAVTIVQRLYYVRNNSSNEW
jgi:CDP-diacylglycerol--glycerol-3-phosphate 3-phosphatidyltransferase